jgi:hypothetical protein
VPVRLYQHIRTAGRFIRDNILYLIRKDEFLLDERHFDGRKVIIIGPADTVSEELTDVDLDRFDHIVRINRSIDTPVRQRGVDSFKFDVLFHSLFEHGEAAASEITAEKVDRCGIKLIIHRTLRRSSIGRTIQLKDMLRRSGIAADLRIISPDFYKELRRRLRGRRPTSGLVCLAYFMRQNLEFLEIVGFTFYRTGYVEGYTRESLSEKWNMFGQSRSGHDPESELRLFAEEYRTAIGNGRKIVLGARLSAIVNGLAP